MHSLVQQIFKTCLISSPVFNMFGDFKLCKTLCPQEVCGPLGFQLTANLENWPPGMFSESTGLAILALFLSTELDIFQSPVRSHLAT